MTWARGLGLAALVLSLTNCSTTMLPGENGALSPAVSNQEQETPANLREHQRILAAYGGAYENARLQSFLAQTVDRLMAAS
ncbi:MAG: hypothetical protein QOD94_1029, partial [Alphaproteobacteria bacterium]|nr:hypothetical protein [Alphaproteobacteria bacterium]